MKQDAAVTWGALENGLLIGRQELSLDHLQTCGEGQKWFADRVSLVSLRGIKSTRTEADAHGARLALITAGARDPVVRDPRVLDREP